MPCWAAHADPHRAIRATTGELSPRPAATHARCGSVASHQRGADARYSSPTRKSCCSPPARRSRIPASQSTCGARDRGSSDYSACLHTATAPARAATSAPARPDYKPPGPQPWSTSTRSQTTSPAPPHKPRASPHQQHRDRETKQPDPQNRLFQGSPRVAVLASLVGAVLAAIAFVGVADAASLPLGPSTGAALPANAFFWTVQFPAGAGQAVRVWIPFLCCVSPVGVMRCGGHLCLRRRSIER